MGWLVRLAVAGSMVPLGGLHARSAEAGISYLAETCRGCHMVSGQGSAMPALGELGRERIADMLADYRDGRRSHPVMNAVAADLDDATVAALADYITAQGKAGR